MNLYKHPQILKFVRILRLNVDNSEDVLYTLLMERLSKGVYEYYN